MPGLGRLPKTHLGLAWPWAKARPCFNFFCLAGPGKKNCVGPGPWGPARAGTLGPRAKQFFLPGLARQKIKAWPGQAIKYILCVIYYILYIHIYYIYIFIFIFIYIYIYLYIYIYITYIYIYIYIRAQHVMIFQIMGPQNAPKRMGPQQI